MNFQMAPKLVTLNVCVVLPNSVALANDFEVVEDRPILSAVKTSKESSIQQYIK